MGFWKENDLIHIDYIHKWENGIWKKYAAYYRFEHGHILKDVVEGYPLWPDDYSWKRINEWLLLLGYDSKSGIRDDFLVESVLNPIVGMTEHEAEKHIKTLVKSLYNGRKDREDHKKQTDELNNRFNGYVIGLAKDFYTYNSGFSIRLLLSSEHSFSERKKFAKNNKKEIIKYALQMISQNKRLIKEIGDIRYYKPVEIVTCKIPEIEIKFEVKDISIFESPA